MPLTLQPFESVPVALPLGMHALFAYTIDVHVLPAAGGFWRGWAVMLLGIHLAAILAGVWWLCAKGIWPSREWRSPLVARILFIILGPSIFIQAGLLIAAFWIYEPWPMKYLPLLVFTGMTIAFFIRF